MIKLFKKLYYYRYYLNFKVKQAKKRLMAYLFPIEEDPEILELYNRVQKLKKQGISDPLTYIEKAQ